MRDHILLNSLLTVEINICENRNCKVMQELHSICEHPSLLSMGSCCKAAFTSNITKARFAGLYSPES